MSSRELTVNSSHGNILISPDDGAVLEVHRWDVMDPESEVFEQIDHFDVDEWQRAYPGEDICEFEDIDILDLGYFLKDKEVHEDYYEEPCYSWREDLKIRRAEEKARKERIQKKAQLLAPRPPLILLETLLGYSRQFIEDWEETGDDDDVPNIEAAKRWQDEAEKLLPTWLAHTTIPADDNMYLLQAESQGFVGNCPVFWAANKSGYTCVIADAHHFTKEEADRQHKERRSDKPWKLSVIKRNAKLMVDMQDLRRES